MPVVADLQLIEAEFFGKHQEYRQIISNTPLASADTADADTAASIVAEGTFIRYFTLWENSIEKSFIYFCQGGVTLSGVQPVCRLANCDADAVRRILTNGQRYLDWSNQKNIRERAHLFLENGTPFYDPVIGKSNVLSDAEKLRNVIAHDSLESWNGYRGVQRHNYQTERSFNMAPGQMLRTLARKTKHNWGEFYFDQIAETFAAILRP